jgi:hypothetical protein
MILGLLLRLEESPQGFARLDRNNPLALKVLANQKVRKKRGKEKIAKRVDGNDEPAGGSGR